MYMLWAAGSDDIVTQKKGIIVLVWFDASFAKLNRSWKIKYKFYTLNCDRISAIHCCSPDTPHYRFRRSVMTMRAGSENLSKLIFHLGESMEIHYKLQGYGIPFEHVPISWTGKVKVQYLKQWMRIRLAIEKYTIHNKHDNNTTTISSSSGSDGSSDESTNPAGDIIECPQLQDVVFRQGTSGVSHPGNVTFRSLIESTVLVEQFERGQQEKERSTSIANAKNNPSNNKKKPKTKRPKQLALQIYEERHRTSSSTGRFLIWNNEKGWWNELNDKEQICMKIEYMVREFQKMTSQRSTKLILQNKHNGRKNYPRGGTSGAAGNCRGSDSNFKTKNIIHLQSGTSLFQSQDGRSPMFTNKRQRLGILGHDVNGGGSSTLPFGGKNEMECFGIKFTPCFT